MGQALQVLLPFRERPVFVSSIGLKRALVGYSEYLAGLSSFLSDHATLFYVWAPRILSPFAQAWRCFTHACHSIDLSAQNNFRTPFPNRCCR